MLTIQSKVNFIYLFVFIFWFSGDNVNASQLGEIIISTRKTPPKWPITCYVSLLSSLSFKVKLITPLEVHQCCLFRSLVSAFKSKRYPAKRVHKKNKINLHSLVTSGQKLHPICEGTEGSAIRLKSPDKWSSRKAAIHGCETS